MVARARATRLALRTATRARPGLRPPSPAAARRRLIPGHGRAHEGPERLFVDDVALVEIDRAPDAAFQARVEQALRVRKRGALGEGRLHGVLVHLAGTEDASERPHRHSPLPLLDDLGVGLPDESAKPGERPAAP